MFDLNLNKQGNSAGLIETLKNAYSNLHGNNTVFSTSKIARIEPITMVSSSLAGVKELPNILHGILNIYAAYYLQAIQLLSLKIVDVRILKILDSVNPDRDINTFNMAKESLYENFNTLSLEGLKYNLLNKSVSLEDESDIRSTITKIETFEKLSYAIGKVLNIKFKDVDVPVVVKLDTMITPSSVVQAVSTANTDEIKFLPRFKDAISGRISFIKDFILCNDIIKANKKIMINDNTGIYTNIISKLNKSKFFGLLTGTVSLGAISSIIIMSDEDEAHIQRNLGSKLTTKLVRDIVFENTFAAVLVVVSKEWERVTIYVRNIPDFSQNSFDDFKSMSSKDNNNIADILKAFNMNNPPVF